MVIRGASDSVGSWATDSGHLLPRQDRPHVWEMLGALLPWVHPPFSSLLGALDIAPSKPRVRQKRLLQSPLKRSLSRWLTPPHHNPGPGSASAPPINGASGLPLRACPLTCAACPPSAPCPPQQQTPRKQQRPFLFHVTVRGVFKNYESVVMPACCRPSEAFYSI